MHSPQYAIQWIFKSGWWLYLRLHTLFFPFDFRLLIKSDYFILSEFNYTHKSGVHIRWANSNIRLEIPMLYVSGIYIKDSSDRINVYGQGFPLNSANTVFAKTNCSYSSCP